MDESVRNYSHTNWSQRHETKAHPKYFYQAVCREADYVRRIGGLPLFIEFDMAAQQDAIYNDLYGLAAGQVYTYRTSPGYWPYGNLTKWLTRYSAYIWCDARRLENPADVIRITAACLAVNIALNLVAIPIWGAVGAAGTTLLSETLLAGWILGLLIRQIRSGVLVDSELSLEGSTAEAIAAHDEAV